MKKATNTEWFIALHRSRFPPEVVDFIYRENKRQWPVLNQCRRAQRVEKLPQFLFGAPYTQNAIHSLHCKIEGQIRRDQQWKVMREELCGAGHEGIFQIHVHDEITGFNP